jgi:hypothetical protein
VSGDSDFAYAIQAVKNMASTWKWLILKAELQKTSGCGRKPLFINRNFFNNIWVIKRRSQRRRPWKGKLMPGSARP